jgi:hypothetical protein
MMEAVEQLQYRIQELKKKVQEKRKSAAGSNTDPEFREIRKKLKRVQRSRRRLLAKAKLLQGAPKEKPQKKAVAAPEKKEEATEAKS